MQISPRTRKKVELALRTAHSIHGRGMVLAIVWAVPFDGIPQYFGIRDTTHARFGMVVSQHQYGMKANEFTVADDYKTIRYLSHTRPVL